MEGQCEKSRRETSETERADWVIVMTSAVQGTICFFTDKYFCTQRNV